MFNQAGPGSGVRGVFPFSLWELAAAPSFQRKRVSMPGFVPEVFVGFLSWAVLTPTPLHGGLAAAELSPAVGPWPALSPPQTLQRMLTALSWICLESQWPTRIRWFGISPPKTPRGLCPWADPAHPQGLQVMDGGLCYGAFSLGNPAPSLCLVGPNSGVPGAAGRAGCSAGLRGTQTGSWRG